MGTFRAVVTVILRIVLALVAVVILIVGLAYLTTVIPPLTSVSSETVAHSLSAEVGGFGECRGIRPGLRECDVFDPATSGSVAYRVQMDSWRCWTTVRIGGIGSLSDRAHSCAHLNDQIGSRIAPRERQGTFPNAAPTEA